MKTLIVILAITLLTGCGVTVTHKWENDNIVTAVSPSASSSIMFQGHELIMCDGVLGHYTVVDIKTVTNYNFYQAYDDILYVGVECTEQE